MSRIYTTQALADAVGGQLIGKGDIAITRLAHPADVRDAGDLALAMDAKLLPLLQKSAARAAVIGKGAEPPQPVEACIVVNRPRLAMARLTNLFAAPVPVVTGIHASAVIEKGARLGNNVSVGALAFIGADAVIGDNSILHPQTYIGPGAVIGEGALIYSGARIASGVRIGARCIIHFNASIGADGFSFVTPEAGSVEDAKASGGGKVSASNRELVRIASLGGVIIGDDVEIGASTSIDQGTIRPTRIGNGSKIDNQVQVGHNVEIGENCLICGRVGIAGSAVIGDRVVLGGGAGVADHAHVGHDVVAMALSGIPGNVAPGTVIGGIPAVPREKMMENYMNLGRLRHFFRKIEALTERMDKIEKE